MSRITRVTDAPPPSPDPWPAEGPEAYRCPACALLDPGPRICRRCRATMVVRVNRRRPLTANIVNLLVVLVGRGPLLLAVALIYREAEAPLLTPWTLWLGAQIPLAWLTAAGLALRGRWAWFLAALLCVADLPAMVGLQLALGGSPVLPLAVVLTDLMVLGFLLTVYDEVRVDEALIDRPAPHAMPPTAMAAFNAGVEVSRVGHWYLAARLWQRAVALEHHEGRYRRALGLAYLRLGELAAAASELAAARALLPDDPQTAELLALLERRRGAGGASPS